MNIPTTARVDHKIDTHTDHWSGPRHLVQVRTKHYPSVLDASRSTPLLLRYRASTTTIALLVHREAAFFAHVGGFAFGVILTVVLRHWERITPRDDSAIFRNSR